METIAKIKKRVFLRKKGYTINASRNKAWQLLSNLKILFPVEVVTVFTTVTVDDNCKLSSYLQTSYNHLSMP